MQNLTRLLQEIIPSDNTVVQNGIYKCLLELLLRLRISSLVLPGRGLALLVPDTSADHAK
jgi:hypothetical protein